VAIPDEILLKQGALTADEYEVVKQHTSVGARILSGGRFPLLQLAEEIALTHHERWDGSGYAGLAGGSIPLPGRIVALVDAFDAMTHGRPYRPAFSFETALAEVEALTGTQFDPSVVTAFTGLARRGEVAGATPDRGTEPQR